MGQFLQSPFQLRSSQSFPLKHKEPFWGWLIVRHTVDSVSLTCADAETSFWLPLYHGDLTFRPHGHLGAEDEIQPCSDGCCRARGGDGAEKAAAHAADARAGRPRSARPCRLESVCLFRRRDSPDAQQGHFAFVVQSKVIPCLILISLCRKWYVFHQFIWGITFQTIMPRIVSVRRNLLLSFDLKVRPLQIKGCYFPDHSLCMAARGTVDGVAL